MSDDSEIHTLAPKNLTVMELAIKVAKLTAELQEVRRNLEFCQWFNSQLVSDDDPVEDGQWLRDRMGR